jgi:hypothetical protein
MERSPICPQCLSKWPDIKSLLYTAGQHVGQPCEDVWHKGSNYDPDRWVLSAQDEEFLETQRISKR